MDTMISLLLAILVSCFIQYGDSISPPYQHPDPYIQPEVYNNFIYRQPSGIQKVLLAGKLYYFQTTIRVNWYEALAYCNSIDMELLSVESKIEDDAIFHYIDEHHPLEEFWTSGTILGKNVTAKDVTAAKDNYYWMSTGRRFTYTNWVPGQPTDRDIAGGREACLGIGDYPNFREWYDDICARPTHFICEERYTYSEPNYAQAPPVYRLQAQPLPPSAGQPYGQPNPPPYGGT